VLARPLSVGTHLARATIVHVATQLTNNFLSNVEHINEWNFAVNGISVNASDCSRNEGLAAMKEVFPDGTYNISPNTDVALSDTVHLQRSWATGAILNLDQRDDGQQHEISFTMDASATGGNVPQMTYMYVCYPVSLDVSSGRLVVTQ